MIILNEREFAENCIKKGVVGENPFNTLSILAKYYYHHCGYRKKRIITHLTNFLSENYPRYESNKLSWQSTIEKIAANAGKHPLHEFSGVKITKSEIEAIQSLHSKVLERLAFTMLCLAKFGNAKNPQNNGWINVDSKTLFDYARITCSADEREVKIGELWHHGLLQFAKRNDNLNCRVTFINDKTPEELFVSDFRELGYEYQAYCGGNFIRCSECGILTRNNSAGTKKYCNDCAKYSHIRFRKIHCIDCGKEFSIPPSSRTIRCPDCRVNERRRIEREKKRRLRSQ